MRALAWLPVFAAIAGAAQAQEPPRWTLVENEGVTIAHTNLQSRVAVVARCAQGQFSVLLQGVPSPSDRMRVTTIVDGSEDLTTSWWLMEGNGMLMSRRPASFIRGLAEGRSVALSAPRAGGTPWLVESPLPEDRAPVDAVLEACDVPTSDPRDAIERQARRNGEAPPVLRWTRNPIPDWPSSTPAHVREGSVVVTCITGPEGRLQDCRAESESPLGAGFGREAAAAANRARLDRNSPVGAVIEFDVIFLLR